jgi:HlyD family secretion protein
VETEKVARRNLIEKVMANGKIEPVIQVKISPEVSGEITQLAVKEGQRVKKGDLLVKIKPDNYLAASNSAAASYHLAVANKSSAEASLEKARLEFERSAGLYKAKLVSDSDYLTPRPLSTWPKPRWTERWNRWPWPRPPCKPPPPTFPKPSSYSPLDGTVSKLNSQLGERVVGTAMMAGTEMMTIADLNTMEARVDVGEVDVVLVAPGQKVHLEVDSFKDRKFNGVVTDVANSANNNDTSSAASFRFQLDGRDEISGQDSRDGEGGLSAGNVGDGRNRNPFAHQCAECADSKRHHPPAPGGCGTDQSPAAAGQTNPPPAATDQSPARRGTDQPPRPVAAVSTNEIKSTGKTNEPPKMVEVVFLVEGDHAKSAPVKRGISDDNYTEIIEGLHEGDTVVSGGYKAINRDLEDGKKVVVGAPPAAGKPKAAAN